MLHIKNWSEFQHYTDRRPPWVKLHHSLLDNFEFHCLPVASKALAPMLWLLASEAVEGNISDDLSKIAFRLRMTPEDVQIALKPLIDKGFIIADSNVLADCNQVATPETETETETETKTEISKPSVSSVRQRNAKYPKPDDVEQTVWQEFEQHRKHKKAVITDLVMETIRREAETSGWNIDDALREVVVRNWQTFKSEWVNKHTAKSDENKEVIF